MAAQSSHVLKLQSVSERTFIFEETSEEESDIFHYSSAHLVCVCVCEHTNRTEQIQGFKTVFREIQGHKQECCCLNNSLLLC